MKIKIFIFLAIGFIATGWGGWLFWNNQKILTEMIDTQKNIRDLELKVLSYDLIKEEYAKVGEQGIDLKKRFVDPNNPVAFIKSIETAAKESQVELSIEIYKPPGKSKKEKEKEEAKEEEPSLELLLVTESGFNSLVSFITKLENLDRYVNIAELKIEKKKATLKDSELTAEKLPGEETEEKEILSASIVINAN